jgi:MFS family permease
MCSSALRPVTTPTANRWSLVVAAGLVVFMAQLDATIVLVALPSIQSDLGVSAAATQWVVLAYVVPLIALTLLSGRWIDVVGHRRALGIGTAGFALASALAGLAPRPDLLIGARIGQGAMAALLLALAPVLAVEAVTPGAKGRALGVVSTLAPLGAVSGPLLGGQLVDAVGWPWIFLVNVPVAVAVAALGGTQLPAEGRWRMPHPAWLGEAALLGGAATASLLALTLTTTHGVAGLLALLVVPAVLAVWGRTDTSRPVRRLVRADGMTGPHLALAAAYTALLLVQFLAPFYLARTLGLSGASAGLVLMAYPVATVLVGPVSGVLTDRRGARPTAGPGSRSSLRRLSSSSRSTTIGSRRTWPGGWPPSASASGSSSRRSRRSP